MILIVSDCNPPLLPPSSTLSHSKTKKLITFAFSDNFESISSCGRAPFNHDFARTIRNELHLVDYFCVVQGESDLLWIKTSRNPVVFWVGVEHVRGIKSFVK